MSKRPTWEKSYEVGYGKPPEAHRFKPGQSGNPKGRKRKPYRSVPVAVAEELRRVITVKEGNTSARYPVGAVLAKKLIAEAAKGNMKALQMALKLLDTLPEDMRDENIRTENQKMIHNMVIGLLDKYKRYKKLYGDLPPEDESPKKKDETSSG